MNERVDKLRLPEFIAGRVVHQTTHYRLVTDYKPGTQDKRFFIEPLTDDAENMLLLSMTPHHLHEGQLNVRETPNGESTKYRNCIRADFSEENTPSLLGGEVDIPSEGEDSIPSLKRLEECLTKHPTKYTLTD